MQLRGYQQQAIENVFAAEARGVRCQALVLATGLGKTVIFASLIARRGGRALVLAHRYELLTQAAAKIRAVNPGARVGIVQGELKQYDADIVVASVQTISRDNHLARLRPDFNTVIVDECHHAAAASYTKIFEHVAPANPLLVGVTATPDRGDGKPLDDWFSEIVFEMSILDGIEQGWLCDLEGRLIHLKDADFSKVHVKKGDYDLSELEAIMGAANWHEHVAISWAEHARERKTVIFVPKVAMAHELALQIRGLGGRAEAIDGAMDSILRRNVLKRLSTGETNVIVNCAVLTEGFDEPSLSCVIMARPTKSRGLYVQCVGRGLRLHESKQSCLVLDMVGVSQRHDLVTLATLAGSKRLCDFERFTAAKKRADDEQKEAEEKAKAEEEERKRIEAELAAKKIELLNRRAEWQNRELEIKERAFAWQVSIDGQRTLHIADRFITVRPMADENWIAVDSKREFRAIGSTPEDCQKRAEVYARNLLINQSEGWRKKPATEKQIARLNAWRIPCKIGITAGEASDLIGRFIEQKKARTAA